MNVTAIHFRKIFGYKYQVKFADNHQTHLVYQLRNIQLFEQSFYPFKNLRNHEVHNRYPCYCFDGKNLIFFWFGAN